MLNRTKKNQQGFTLMELMITVAIIGIISAIAMPSYTKYVIKTKRTDAKVALMTIAQKQESFFVQNMSYAQNLTTLGFPTDVINSENDNYSVQVVSAIPANCNTAGNPACTAFNIEAAPFSASQRKDHDCIRFRLSNTGLRGVSTGVTTSPVVATTAPQIQKCWK